MPPRLSPVTRLVSTSASGRYVAIRQAQGIDVVDALGTAPRAAHAVAEVEDFACVGEALWVIARGTLRRFSLESGEELSPHSVDSGAGELVPGRGESASAALWWGPTPALIRDVEGSLNVERIELSAGAVAAPLAGRHFVVAEGSALRFREPPERELSKATLPGGRPRSVTPIFAGRALAALLRDGEAESVVVLRPSGALVHHINVPKAVRWTVADTRGLALIATESEQIVAVDLRHGKPIGRVEAPVPVEDWAVDTAGRYLAIAGFREGQNGLSVLHTSYAELFGGGGTRRRAGESEDDSPAGRDARSGDAARTPNGASRAALRDLIGKREPRAETGPAPEDEDAARDDRELDQLPDLPAFALQPINGGSWAENPATALAHLDAHLELAGARAARAIARAWHSGRLSVMADDDHPFEREVFALAGGHARAASGQLASLESRVADAEARLADIESRASAEGSALPLDSLARDFELSRVGREILFAVAAPALRGEVARLYGILANDESRSACDAHLLELLLEGTQGITGHRIARELSPDAPLVRNGLVDVHPKALVQPIFHPLTVDPVLLSRLRGEPLAGLGQGAPTRIRRADRALDELAIPAKLRRELVLAVSREPAPQAPLRLALKGRPGTGRHAILAALAARAGRVLAVIDCEKLAVPGRSLAEALRAELRRASLRGAIPCVDGLETVAPAGEEGTEAIKDVLRSHPGPVLARISREFKPPLDPGYVELEVPPMSEGERLAYWEKALARRGLEAAQSDELASRFRIGAGTIEAVINAVCLRRAAEPRPPADASATLDEAARQHIDTRLGQVASRVDRLVRWEQVALPDDVLDSIREFVGRVKHRRTVYEAWGFDAKMTTSQGLSALFYGPPGTGKSMVAGLIARELSLDLYRVDLARITSKWIGETEKNLAQIFDAAEDGQSIILFDEADSLFAKRTEVKSSVDRYANLEVNYLLQRLDSFEGIAILTTNQEGSMDTAFKRRLSLRLAFPFPDEEMRVKLWAAHIPPEVPTAGTFDFEDLARRFPMSGGYIQNSALRAAFLAAQEDVSLSQDHLVRAIHLEYREMGKLAPGGKME